MEELSAIIDIVRGEFEGRIADLERRVFELEADASSPSAGGGIIGGSRIVPFVPRTVVDDSSVDRKGDDATIQIAGFGGGEKKDATNLALTGSPSSDEFLCRSGDVIAYRKLSASGGGGGTSGISQYEYVSPTMEIQNPSSESPQLVLKAKRARFEDGLAKEVESESVIARFTLAKHSEL